MLNGLFFFGLLIVFATENESSRLLQSKKRLRSVRLLPGQQNPYSGYALPPGAYTAPAYNNGAQSGYPYQPRAGLNPGTSGMTTHTLPPIPAAAFPDVPPSRYSPTPATRAPVPYIPTPTFTPYNPIPATPRPIQPYTAPPQRAAIIQTVRPLPFSTTSSQLTSSSAPTSPHRAHQPFTTISVDVGYTNTLPTFPPPTPTSTKSSLNPSSQTFNNMGYPSSILPSQQSPEMIKNQVGSVGQQQSTTPPREEMKHDANLGLYLAMLLLLPCTIGGCCIGRMFFTPKQGLFYPEPLMYAEHPDHLSYPAGASYVSNPTRSSSLHADVANSQDRRGSSYHNTVDPQFQEPHDPYYATTGYDDPMYDYGGTPTEPKQRMNDVTPEGWDRSMTR